MHMSEANHKNIVVVGAGIIGTSVATMLSKVSPNWHIDMFERLEGAGIESSNCLLYTSPSPRDRG